MKIAVQLILMVFCYSLFGQDTLAKKNVNRYVVWFSPEKKATKVNGLMLNFFPNNVNSSDTFGGYPNVNGVELNLNPLVVFALYPLMVGIIVPEFYKPPEEDFSSIDFKNFKVINGIHANILNLESTVTNGLELNLYGSFNSKTNGVSFAFILNKHYEVNGITFAYMGNQDIVCNGIQIGLFNTCRNLKGVQIGLYNKNQKRSLPFINWSF
ncbi:LA_2272 family surface repeat-containing protein [Mariniflexile sp. HNIBRBA6329]|uniref:LA_2272 family surface repeat-containing protein n=1 Tax=Mariniflexile sp. HNIBRBA6329 TaxID=3373088 RepID=UPI00374633D6